MAHETYPRFSLSGKKATDAFNKVKIRFDCESAQAARRMRRTGKVMMRPINSSTPPTAMPTSRNGMSNTQTMG